MALFGIGKSKAEKELATLLKGAELPTFQRTTVELLEKLRDPEVVFEQVADGLQWDPGLSTRVLATVNSVAFGSQQKIDDLRHAVSFMGRSQLEQLVLALAVRKALPSAPARGFQPRRFWGAAAFRAALSRAFAGRLHPAREGEAFTTGFLQDMAVPVLAAARPDDYGSVLETWHADPELGLAELEESRFGWSHARVGGLLGTALELPETLVDGIALHHSDGARDEEVLPAVRLVAWLHETRDEYGIEALVECARSDYGLDPDWTRAAVETSEQLAADLAERIG